MQGIAAAPPRAAANAGTPNFKTPPSARARSFDAGISRAGAPLVSLPTTPASLLHRDFRPHTNTPIARRAARARSLTAPALTDSAALAAVAAGTAPASTTAAAAGADAATTAADQLEDSGIATASELGEFVGGATSLKESSSYSSFDDVSLLQLESSEASVPRGFGERFVEVRRYDDTSSEDRQLEVRCVVLMLYAYFKFHLIAEMYTGGIVCVQ
jgi:hypothetical protein